MRVNADAQGLSVSLPPPKRYSSAPLGKPWGAFSCRAPEVAVNLGTALFQELIGPSHPSLAYSAISK